MLKITGFEVLTLCIFDTNIPKFFTIANPLNWFLMYETFKYSHTAYAPSSNLGLPCYSL